MKKLLMLTAVAESGTGVVLFAYPPIVVWLLFGAEIVGAGIILSRIAGIALIALGVACWPGTPRIGMLVYSASAALYLAYVGLAGGYSGILLWPAVAIHVLLSVLLARTGAPT